MINSNSNKLCSIFDAFNMQNIELKATRTTPTSNTLLDLTVTSRRDLVSSTDVFPLGIPDHNLIYVALRLKKRRPPPKF